LLGLSLAVFCAATAVLTAIASAWWYRQPFPFYRPRIRILWPSLTAFIIGTLGAVSLNQNIITGDYHHAATEEAFAASTIASALPAMQTFTADCQRILLLGLLLILLVWGGEHWLRQRHRPLPTLPHLRRSGQ